MDKIISIRITEEQDEILNSLVLQAKKDYRRNDINKSTIIRQLIDNSGNELMGVLVRKLEYYNNITEELKHNIKELRKKRFESGNIPEEVAQLMEV